MAKETLSTNMTKSTETEIEVLKNQMHNIETKVDEGFKSLKDDNARVEKLILDFMQTSESKFANKWVENAMSYAIYTVMGIVLSALIYLVVTIK